MKKKFSTIKNPILMLFTVSIIVSVLQNLSVFSSPAVFISWLISFSVSQLIAQILAYFTFWPFKSKGERAAWINYIVWAVLLNLGSFVEIINLL